MVKKETQQRVLEIKNFKNIGVSKLDNNTYELSDKQEEFLLNVSYKDDSHGGLVVVIGENNTGKSNIAKGLDKFSFEYDNPFDENDFPNFSNYDSCEPYLKFALRDYVDTKNGAKYTSNILATISQENGEIKYEFCNNKEALKAGVKIYATKYYKLSYDPEAYDFLKEAEESKNKKELLAIYSKIKAKEKYEDDVEKAIQEECNELLESAKEIINEFDEVDNKYDIFDYCFDANACKKEWVNIKQKIESVKDYRGMLSVYHKMKDFIKQVQDSCCNSYSCEIPEFNFINSKNMKEIEEQVKYQIKTIENIDEVLDEVFKGRVVIENKDSLSLYKIFNYENIYENFMNSDLVVSLDELSESRFFKALFNAINQPMYSVLNAYKKAETTPAFLGNQERVISERIKNIVTKKFNEIFGKNSGDDYVFEIRLEEHRISFSIYKNNDENINRDVLILEQQSSGFRWFFDLYFNLLNGKILKSGDIVIMDEPAHNLSPKARKECAEYLRKYGEENGVTFIVVTHDVFWIDSDFLNEVRIIKNRDDEELKGVSIQNDFSRILSNDTDTFLDIKRAFGVDTNVFYPPKTQIIFVEGITDYNYLTTFKLLKQKENNEQLNIAFLPICGLGNEGEREIVLEKLMKQCDEPILLVDSGGASKEIKKIKEIKNYDALHIVEIGEIDSAFTDIESLFSKQDIEKYGLDVKSSGVSSAFKKHILWSKDDVNDEGLDNTTKANFCKVLTHLTKDL